MPQNRPVADNTAVNYCSLNQIFPSWWSPAQHRTSGRSTESAFYPLPGNRSTSAGQHPTLSLWRLHHSHTRLASSLLNNSASPGLSFLWKRLHLTRSSSSSLSGHQQTLLGYHTSPARLLQLTGQHPLLAQKLCHLFRSAFSTLSGDRTTSPG
jgi:hypothetical protein